MVLRDGVGGPKKENGPETPSPWIIMGGIKEDGLTYCTLRDAKIV